MKLESICRETWKYLSWNLKIFVMKLENNMIMSAFQNFISPPGSTCPPSPSGCSCPPSTKSRFSSAECRSAADCIFISALSLGGSSETRSLPRGTALQPLTSLGSPFCGLSARRRPLQVDSYWPRGQLRAARAPCSLLSWLAAGFSRC